MGDRYILEQNIEFTSASQQVFTDTSADDLTLGNKFSGIKLGDNSFEHFITD